MRNFAHLIVPDIIYLCFFTKIGQDSYFWHLLYAKKKSLVPAETCETRNRSRNHSLRIHLTIISSSKVIFVLEFCYIWPTIQDIGTNSAKHILIPLIVYTPGL